MVRFNCLQSCLLSVPLQNGVTVWRLAFLLLLVAHWSVKSARRSRCYLGFLLLLFLCVLGSHLPMSRKLLGDFAELLRDLQSPIKWYNTRLLL